MSKNLLVRCAAVLGAGVMGAQIAAHLTNAGVDTVLFDLPAKDGDPNGIAARAIANLAKLSPAPLANARSAEEKLRAYWAMKGAPPPERQERLVAKLAALEKVVLRDPERQ